MIKPFNTHTKKTDEAYSYWNIPRGCSYSLVIYSAMVLISPTLLWSQGDMATQVERRCYYIHTCNNNRRILTNEFADILQQLAGCRPCLPNFLKKLFHIFGIEILKIFNLFFFGIAYNLYGKDLLSRYRTTIGAKMFNFSVRNGKRWNHLA